jgi:hypothetical protein
MPALAPGLLPCLPHWSRLRLHMRLWRRLLLRRLRLLLLHLRLLRLGYASLAAFVLAAAAAAPMPLLLSLANGRDRPQFSLGLCQFCCHV